MDQQTFDAFESIIKAFEVRDEATAKTTDKLAELIKELQKTIIEQNEQIKDLQDTVSDMVLLTGPTDSNN